MITLVCYITWEGVNILKVSNCLCYTRKGGVNFTVRIGTVNPVPRDSLLLVVIMTENTFLLHGFVSEKYGYVECFAMGEIILVFYLLIFRIRLYGKFSFTRKIRSDHVFPVGPQGIRN